MHGFKSNHCTMLASAAFTVCLFLIIEIDTGHMVLDFFFFWQNNKCLPNFCSLLYTSLQTFVEVCLFKKKIRTVIIQIIQVPHRTLFIWLDKCIYRGLFFFFLFINLCMFLRSKCCSRSNWVRYYLSKIWNFYLKDKTFGQ